MRLRISYLIVTLIAILALAPVRADVVYTTPRLARNFRVLYSSVATPTTTGTSQETFYTYSVPAGTLVNAGDSVRAECLGTGAANNNSRSLDMYWAGTQVSGKTTAAAVNNGGFEITATIIRVTASSQVANGRGTSGINGTTEALAKWHALPAEDLTAAVTITCKGTTPTAAGDVTGRFFTVWFIPALN